MSKFLSENVIVHEFTCVHTPQQSDIAERKNRHLLEVTRTLLFQMNVPKSYWGEAVFTAAYLINRLSSRVLDGKSSIEFISSFFPSVSFLSNFHCRVFVDIHSQFRGKFDHKGVKCTFIGYGSNKKGYCWYHPPSKKFFTSKDVTFDENKSFYERPQL